MWNYLSFKKNPSSNSSPMEKETVKKDANFDMDHEDYSPLMDKGKKPMGPTSSLAKTSTLIKLETKISNSNSILPRNNDFVLGSGIFNGELGEYDESQIVMIQSYFDDMDIPTGVDFEVPLIPEMNPIMGSKPTHDSIPSQFLAGQASAGASVDDDHEYAVMLQSYLDDLDIPSGVDFEIPLLNSSGSNSGYYHAVLQSYFDDLDIPTCVDFEVPCLNNSTISSIGNPDQSGTGAASSSNNIEEQSSYDDKILKKFDEFKRFDTVEDYSDHHYAKEVSSKHPSKSWAKKIQDEWRILEKDLPEAIFVRVYESRMHLLRAVIVGAEGTPYHDGLFFFDLLFPDNYPNVPPLVYYHSHGLRINPNLYSSGKVCLSLLITWTGGKKEIWNPHSSTILQVLVSIQGLILNAEPYFNEPGYEFQKGTPKGETSSMRYNENTFISSLRTMVYAIKKPPKYFEDLVVGHYYKHARIILASCKAYSDGARVGSLVRGTVPNVRGGGNKGCCTKEFKDNLAGYMNLLADALAHVGYKGF